MTHRDARMFRDLAEYYDPLLASKDYAAESRRVETIARRYGRSGGRAWLDVACGTGRHLEFLRRRYSVTGLDLSPDMLRIARRRLPGVRLIRGDMRAFRLATRFDVITCLFSAIGRLDSEKELGTTFSNFARTLRPGGVAIVEPWILPAQFRSDLVHLVTYQDDRIALARMAHSTRRGNRSLVQYHYLIGTPHRPVRYVHETARGLLVSPRRLQEIMESVGLRSRFLERGLTAGRGLLIGAKPGPRSRVR